jgi:hypothetical protein
LVSLLSKHVNSKPNIQILTNTTVEALLWSSNETSRWVTGIQYRPTLISNDDPLLPLTSLTVDAVIVTSGGSAYDMSDGGVMDTYARQYKGMATSSGPQADGKGVLLGREVRLTSGGERKRGGEAGLT